MVWYHNGDIYFIIALTGRHCPLALSAGGNCTRVAGMPNYPNFEKWHSDIHLNEEHSYRYKKILRSRRELLVKWLTRLSGTVLTGFLTVGMSDSVGVSVE